MQVLDKLKTLDRTKGRDHYDEMWAILRALALLDARVKAGRNFDVEYYEKITANICALVELIIDEQLSPSKELVVH